MIPGWLIRKKSELECTDLKRCVLSFVGAS